MSMFNTLRTAIANGSEEIPELLPSLFSQQLTANPDIQRMLPERPIPCLWGKTGLEVRPLPVAAWRAGKAGAIFSGTPAATFRSSGTTSADKSATILDQNGLDLYEAALMTGFRTTFGHKGERIVALMPDSNTNPESSLSTMCEILGSEFVYGDGWQAALTQKITDAREPLILFGTAFAWVHFLDATFGSIDLPVGSRLIETGGFKGKSRELP